ncbi:MAG: hypothetical protein WA364_08825 [Candidatus Nitrosopolaris sp.]
MKYSGYRKNIKNQSLFFLYQAGGCNHGSSHALFLSNREASHTCKVLHLNMMLLDNMAVATVDSSEEAKYLYLS